MPLPGGIPVVAVVEVGGEAEVVQHGGVVSRGHLLPTQLGLIPSHFKAVTILMLHKQNYFI